VQANGKSHADAILVGTLGEDTILEPVDFKWTLETADTKQVSTLVLQGLLNPPPPLLSAALESAVASVAPVGRGEPRLHDGIFLAPDTLANRAHLAPTGPMESVWAALVSVDWTEFFPPLIGWNVGLDLARIERTTIATLEQAERYYRLGAGVRGGLRKLAAGIFASEPDHFDDLAALARLQRNHHLRTVPEIVAYLDRALTGRSELLQALRTAERAAYPFGRFAADLKGMGINVRTEDRRWRAMYGGVIKQLGARIRAEGKQLVESGSTEQQALVALGERSAQWLAAAQQLLRAAVAESQS
jgi:hypothetical protein